MLCVQVCVCVCMCVLLTPWKDESVEEVEDPDEEEDANE